MKWFFVVMTLFLFCQAELLGQWETVVVVRATCENGARSRGPVVYDQQKTFNIGNGWVLNATNQAGEPRFYVVTVAHLLHEARQPEVFANGQWVPGQPLAVNPAMDCALIYFPGLIPREATSLADTDPPDPTAVDLAVWDVAGDMRFHVIRSSLTARPFREADGFQTWTITPRTKNGFSGGPVFYSGKVVGMVWGTGAVVPRAVIAKFLSGVTGTPGGVAVDAIPPTGSPEWDILSTRLDQIDTEARARDKILFDGITGIQGQLAAIPLAPPARPLVEDPGTEPPARQPVEDPEKNLPGSPPGWPPVEPDNGPPPVSDVPGGPLKRAGIKIWDWLSPLAWTALGTALAGTAGGFIAGRIGSRIHRRARERATKPRRRQPDDYQPRQMDFPSVTVEPPPPRPTQVVYQSPPAETGLARMREAMKLTGEYYPGFRQWAKLIEDVYSKLKSGEK